MDGIPNPFAALFILGAILLVTGILGGGLELQVARFGVTMPKPSSRVGAFVACTVGGVLMVLGLLLWIVGYIAYHPPESSYGGGGSARAAGLEPTEPPAPIAAEPSRAIASGSWDFAFVVVSNSCGPDPVPGQTADVTLLFQESRLDDGYVSDGEGIAVFDADGTRLSDTALTWPTLEFAFRVDGGYVGVYNEFTTPHLGRARWEEHYATATGECVVVLEEPQ